MLISMRPQTKKMLRLLKAEDVITDTEATKAGVINPRREAGLLESREGHEISIVAQSYAKREYRLIGGN